MAGVSFGVLGNGETCTGDSARRAGNEFVFQGLAQQNIETLTEAKAKQVVSTCPHCMNTLKNEYKQLGIELDVIHHTQLLNRLVREGKLTPVAEGDGAHQRKITYHDPCFLGRHNQVYTPPRDLLQIMPGAELDEMERSGERSFCCGAGGARMWMEETIGERINVNRTNEAVATGADQIAVGCPFCRVMLADGLTEAQDNGSARAEVEVLDVAQMLLASVKGEVATKLQARRGREARRGHGEEGRAEKELADPEKAGAAAKASSGGHVAVRRRRPRTAASRRSREAGREEGVVGRIAVRRGAGRGAEADAKSEPEAKSEVKSRPAKADTGGSLFDTPAAELRPEPKPEAEEEAEQSRPEAEPAAKPSRGRPGHGRPEWLAVRRGRVRTAPARRPKAAEPAPAEEEAEAVGRGEGEPARAERRPRRAARPI